MCLSTALRHGSHNLELRLLAAAEKSGGDEILSQNDRFGDEGNQPGFEMPAGVAEQGEEVATM